MARKKKDQTIMNIAEIEAISAEQPKFGKGITVASGFDLGAKSALDSRSTVKTIAERDAHVTGNRAYEGMLVYVEDTQKTYQYVNNVWKTFGFDVDEFQASIEDSLTSSSTTNVLSANQGKVLNEKITAVDEKVINVAGRLDNLAVPWNKVTEKPFATVGEGLHVNNSSIKVNTDDSTVEIKNGKVAVKDEVFAPFEHTHETHDITWNEIDNKPAIFSKSCSADEWNDAEELVALTVNHMQNSTNLIVKVMGTDTIERLVAVEYIDADNIKIWSDIKEDVTVTIFSYDFNSNSALIYSAIADFAVAGQVICDVV